MILCAWWSRGSVLREKRVGEELQRCRWGGLRCGTGVVHRVKKELYRPTIKVQFRNTNKTLIPSQFC
jgi:hypothetical protein